MVGAFSAGYLTIEARGSPCEDLIGLVPHLQLDRLRKRLRREIKTRVDDR